MRSSHPRAASGRARGAVPCMILGVILLLTAPATAHDLLQFTDVQPILARNCDALVLVARAGETSSKDLRAALKRLRDAGDRQWRED